MLKIRFFQQREGAKMDKKFARIMAIVLAGVMVLGIIAMVIPALGA